MLDAAPSSDLLLLGKGQLLYNPYDDNGDPTYFRHFGNVDTFEVTTADDVVEKYSSMTKNSPLYKKVPRRRTVTLRMTLTEFSEDNLALMLMGNRVELTQVATPVVAEAVDSSVKLGGYYRVAKFGPYSAFAPKTGSTALIEGTDWEWFSTKLGIIKLLTTASNITDGEPLTVDYTPTAYSSGSGVQSVNGGSESFIETALQFIADPASGPAWHVDVWKASMTPDGAIGFIGDDFATAVLVATIEDDSVNHPSNPLYRAVQL